MSCARACICLIFPPLAVIDRGCGIVLTLAGWVPGVIAALILNYMAEN
ncbi:MAG: YqaE/Pmp3 family membrane protein [Anaerolineae bacterium]|nr:YqaE/Pmp3 family membrane protein [Anaerolineae bacterium]